jgi:hypothetical protein
MEPKTSIRHSLSARVSEFDIPPVTDGLLIGKDSPIGYSAISKALNLLVADNFVTVEVEDDTISHCVVRRAIIRRIPQDKLVAFLLERIKPLMCAQEILHLELKTDVMIEESDL